MEQFDILDREGNSTGIVADKGSTLVDGQYYLGVHGYLYNPLNEFLLQQRAFDKEFLPGGWDIHMGHVTAGETSQQGMIRELKEEIGISISNNNMRFIGRVFWETYHHMIDIYFIEIDFANKQLSLQASEVIGVKSVNIDDILSLVEKMNYRPIEYRQIVINELNNLKSLDI